MPDLSRTKPYSIYPKPARVKIAVIGLGYVGLPLAVEFASKFEVIGFDVSVKRIAGLLTGFDRTREVEAERLQAVLAPNGKLFCTSEAEKIADCNVFIIAVPTPTDQHNRPDLRLIKEASALVGKALKKGDLVIYESTVYPGLTEGDCVPVLEAVSGLRFNRDFFAGYSPERINPGDKEHTLVNIKKITSGSTPEAAAFVNGLYLEIIEAGTHLAPSIKVAEAAKVIENSQRDINIAFVNELAKIFNLMGIDTGEVLEAASTKWNFLKFKPGLVGGHCTGIDPYYLAQKAQEVGYHPEIILAGRRLNDGMGAYIALEVIKLMVKKDIPVKQAKVLILGFTFKENCPDVRNTRVIDIVKVFNEFETELTVYDPWADPEEVKQEYGFATFNQPEQLKNNYDAIVLSVAHQEFQELDLNSLKNQQRAIIYDIKGALKAGEADGRL
ncbi:nucleotide sugar dehydrogenase [Mucilaginibacter arboris]|uniref:Nucleotide sugar dehydrogenase n=1 Tax=Mucilaginibacter arboris TaxID=2682090 RepID=A0A7K1SWL1_9SPHI|nr:nucleotide sugar dehydrogenase [Mucilaginibacter arboris]MVN21719.1 nucleotide sugar dehydrogenase [Mucilaginibacter arboris]